MKIFNINEVHIQKRYIMETTSSITLITDTNIEELYDKELMFFHLMNGNLEYNSIIDIECNFDDITNSTMEEVELGKTICKYFFKEFNIMAHIKFLYKHRESSDWTNWIDVDGLC